MDKPGRDARSMDCVSARSTAAPRSTAHSYRIRSTLAPQLEAYQANRPSRPPTFVGSSTDDSTPDMPRSRSTTRRSVTPQKLYAIASNKYVQTVAEKLLVSMRTARANRSIPTAIVTPSLQRPSEVCSCEETGEPESEQCSCGAAECRKMSVVNNSGGTTSAATSPRPIGGGSISPRVINRPSDSSSWPTDQSVTRVAEKYRQRPAKRPAKKKPFRKLPRRSTSE